MLEWLKKTENIYFSLKNNFLRFFSSEEAKKEEEKPVFTWEVAQDIRSTQETLLCRKRVSANYSRNFGYLSGENKKKKLEKFMRQYRKTEFHKEKRVLLKEPKHKFMSKHFPKNYKSPASFVCFVKDLRTLSPAQDLPKESLKMPKKVYSPSEEVISLAEKLSGVSEDQGLKEAYRQLSKPRECN